MPHAHDVRFTLTRSFGRWDEDIPKQDMIVGYIDRSRILHCYIAQ